MKGGLTRLLLVGYGLRGRQWQAHCRRRRDVVIAGVVDPDPVAREAATDSTPVVFSHVEEALSSRPFDGAIIASPPSAHVAGAVACLRAGVGVLVEKPLARSLADATHVARRAADARRPALVVQNFRFLPRERAMARALQLDILGAPLRGTVGSSRAVRCEDPLWEFALHHVDALRARFGAAPEHVSAEVSPDGTGITAELFWSSGVSVRYVHQEGTAGYTYRERVECSGGAVVVDDQRVHARPSGGRSRRVRAPRAPHPDIAVLEEFLAALCGRPSSLHVDDNLLTVATVEAMAHAAERAEEVKVGGV